MPYDYVLLLQAVVAKAGAVPALVKRLIRTAPHEDDHNLFCLERICAALASLMLYPGNRERLHGTVMYAGVHNSMVLFQAMVVRFYHGGWWLYVLYITASDNAVSVRYLSLPRVFIPQTSEAWRSPYVCVARTTRQGC